MKQKLTLLMLALFFSLGTWAENFIVPSANKVNKVVSGGYYVIDGLAQDGTTSHYLYDDGSRVTSGALPTDATAEKFMWKINGNSSDGYTLQNKFTGNYMSLGTSNNSLITTGSTPQSNVIYIDESTKYATICNATSNQAIDVGYGGKDPRTWSGSTTEATGSRRLMFYDVAITLDGIYTIKAYFSNYTDLYFTNDDGTLVINASKTNSVKDYWIARSSENATFPWKLESGRGDGKFLSPVSGLSDTGGWFQIPYCTNITTEKCCHLYGSFNDASTSDLRYLATWSPDGTSPSKTGFAKYGSGGCYGGNHNNSNWSTDYILEEVTGVDLYTVISNINVGGVTYNPSYTGVATQTNGGFYILPSAPSASDFTKISIDNYTAGDVVVDASAKTITLNYTANITYTLTDMNGATYSWSASGDFGTTPTLTGCDEYTLSNEVWDEEACTYTADITFQFPVSSNDVTNYTYIGCHKYYGYHNQMYLYAKTSSSTDIRVQKNIFPTNESGENERYMWAIFPTFSDGAFTFTIKNASTGTFITSDSDQNDHSGDEVSLTNTGTPLIYKKDATYNECWYIPSTSKYLSVNSYNTTSEQFLGTWNKAHSGTNVAFIEPTDFTTLLTILKTAYNSFNEYIPYFASGTYTEAVEGTMASAYANNGVVRNVVNNPPSTYLTATQFQTYTNTYNNAINSLSFVMPTGSFIRIKNADGSKYVKASAVNEYLLLSAGGADAASIFYLTGSNNLIALNTGLYSYAASVSCPIEYAPTYVDIYEFLLGSAAGRVKVHAATNPTGWGHGRYWKDADAGTFVDRTESSYATDYIIEAVTSLPVTISSVGIATLYSPVALTIPTDVTAYVAIDKGEYLSLTAIEGGIIPASTGVILVGDEGTYDFDITTGGSVGSNALSGTVYAISRPDGSYVLSTQGGTNVGFYNTGASTIPGFKAYLPAGTGDVKFFRFDDEDAINSIAAEEEEVGCYDLSGRRVKAPVRGLYILNGKKVIVK